MIGIGSRGSQLALWQARWVESRLNALGETCRIDVIKTTGDKITSVPLARVGGKGLFTKEIEDALLSGSIDVAVHSLKDMPAILPDGLTLAAIPEREDVRDALIGCRLAELPHGAVVGTSSLRRSAQLRALRPDVRIEMLRGNLDTRLRKLDDGQYNAIVLAAAGLRRLGWAERIAELVPVETICPAAGQGALAVETRAGNGHAARLCRQLDHAPSRNAVTAERAALATLGGSCQVPIGAYAEISGERLRLRAVVVAPDGSRAVRGEESGSSGEAEAIGRALGERLLREGAREILAAVNAAQVT
jgi:hydroxymethylbilane synthase